MRNVPIVLRFEESGWLLSISEGWPVDIEDLSLIDSARQPDGTYYCVWRPLSGSWRLVLPNGAEARPRPFARVTKAVAALCDPLGPIGYDPIAELSEDMCEQIERQIEAGEALLQEIPFSSWGFTHLVHTQTRPVLAIVKEEA